MGGNQSKGQPSCGMMPDSKPVLIKDGMGVGIWHQQGADGKTYFIFKNPCFCFGDTYLEASDALKENTRAGRFLKDGQAWVSRSPYQLPTIKKAQEEIRQIARDNGVEIDYECFEYGTGYVMQRT